MSLRREGHLVKDSPYSHFDLLFQNDVLRLSAYTVSLMAIASRLVESHAFFRNDPQKLFGALENEQTLWSGR